MTTERDEDDRDSEPHHNDAAGDDDLRAVLAMYGEVSDDAPVDVVVDDDADLIASAIDRAHDHGYVLVRSADATDDATPVKRRLRFAPAHEAGVADYDTEDTELIPDGGVPDPRRPRQGTDLSEGDVDRCPDCGAYAAHTDDHDPTCPQFEPLSGTDTVTPSAEDNPRMVRPTADGGHIHETPRHEQIASSIVAAQKGDQIHVEAVDDVAELHYDGDVVSNSKHGDTHIVAFETDDDVPTRVVVRFRRHFTDVGMATVRDLCLFDPRADDRLHVDAVDRTAA